MRALQAAQLQYRQADEEMDRANATRDDAAPGFLTNASQRYEAAKAKFHHLTEMERKARNAVNAGPPSG